MIFVFTGVHKKNSTKFNQESGNVIKNLKNENLVKVLVRYMRYNAVCNFTKVEKSLIIYLSLMQL